MPQLKPTNVWTQLSKEEVCQRLTSIDLALYESDRVLVCTRCKYALQPTGQTVSKHLWEKHFLPAKERAGLNQFVRNLDLPDPNTLPKRPDGDPIHPHLLAQSGFACLQCDYRTTSETLLRRHLSQEHGHRTPDSSTTKDRCWSKATLQSWTQNGKRGFWIVASSESEELQAVQQSPRRKRKLSQICQAEVERTSRRCQFIRDRTPNDPILSSNWIRRTGWVQMFSNMDRGLLLNLAQPPVTQGVWTGADGEGETLSSAQDERRLVLIGIAIDRFFDQCEDTVLHTDHSLLCWLRSQHFGKPYKAPFELPGRNATRKRYRAAWKKMMFFCIRAHLVQVQDAVGSASGVPFSAHAWSAIEALWNAVSGRVDLPPEQASITAEYLEHHVQPLSGYAQAQADDEDAEEDDLDESSSDSEESDDEFIQLPDVGTIEGSPGTPSSLNADLNNDGNMRQPRIVSGTGSVSHVNNQSTDDLLLDAVAKFCVFVCTEPFHDGRSATTIIVYFAGVLGIGRDGVTYERPRNYTSKLSAIIHCARLCLLEATLPRFPHWNLDWGPRPSLGQDKLLNQMREAFLCQGSSAPVSELLSLRAYGRVLARTDGSTFRVEWTDDGESVKWEDGILTMNQFRALGYRALNLVQETIGEFMGAFRPTINLSLLRDRISEHRHGYSFVQEPKNDISSAYLNFANRICADTNSGLMTKNGWNMRSVRQLLRKEEMLLEQIMLMMYLRGGQASRTTEFFSLRCWNGESTSRGVYVHEGSILYVTRHSKARRATNREFQVARYLPESDSVALATYLVYVRPLAEMIYRSSFGTDRERKLLFSSLQEPEKLWRADRLTSALKKLTLDVAGVEIGVQAYRQLSVAVTERHLAHLSSPFNRYDDKGADAKIEVAFAWQSGHRPLQRGTSYGIDAAYPDSLQPALLRVYKWASGEWHHFLDRKADVRKSLGLEGNIHQGSQASRKRVPTVSTPGKNQARRHRTQQRINLSLPEEPFVSRNRDDCASPPRRVNRTIDPYNSNDFGSISCQPPRTAGKPSDTRQMDWSLIGDKNMEGGVRILTHDLRRDAAPQYFHYYAGHRVLICKEHRYAVTSWKRHLSDYHAISASALKDAARSLQDLDIVKPEDAETPTPNGPPLEYLQPSRLGFECRGTSENHCGRISISRPAIAQHCNKMHAWRASVREKTNWNEVKVQSFCPTSGKQRWFVVHD